MSDSEFDRRKDVSFLQAEGVEPFPRLLSGPVVTRRFRAASLKLILDEVGFRSGGYGSVPRAESSALWVHYLGRYEDELPNVSRVFNKHVKEYCADDARLLDLIQYCVRVHLLTEKTYRLLASLMRREKIGYRFLGEYQRGNLTLVPISDEAEADANQYDYAELSAFNDARTHFLQAARELKEEHYRGSVTESISGVESVLKSVSGDSTASLGKALNIVAKEKQLNPQLKQALEKLYAWSNGPDGMRHSLAEGAEPITENEARFMMSACLAFAAWIKRCA